MYRNVYELTADEMAELKENLFYGCYENSNLDEEEQLIIDNALYSEDIPNKIIYSAFSGYEFVEDDFFCNM